MLRYKRLKKRRRTFQALTGITVEEFKVLLISFRSGWEGYVQEHHVNGRDRQRQYGGGRKPTLKKTEDKLLFILFYFKMYPIQELQGWLFGMSQSQAHEWIHKLTPVLQKALGYEKQLPERQPQNLEQVLERCPELTFFVDGTERRRQRPKDPAQQKEYYSGKKKTHTQKNLVITDRGRRVKYLSQTYEGKKHDKAICDTEEYTFPDESTLYQDSGFQGYDPGGPDKRVQTVQPKKKPRNGELTEEEKRTNQAMASVRILVEHAICGVKRCRIVKDVFRNHLPNFGDAVMEVACGLHNFRLSNRPVTA